MTAHLTMTGLRRAGLIGLLVALIAAGLGMPSHAARAQDNPNPNLLTNGGLERPYYGQASATQTAPQGWSLWVGGGSPEAFPHTDRVQVLDGEASWNIHQGYTVFTVAGYQRVTGLTKGDVLEAAASGWVYTCNNTQDSCVIPDAPYRRSDPAAGASLKVGIDPTGGVDPNAATVKWSAGTAPYDQWARMSVVATAEGDAVTVFLYATQQSGLALNNVYWDQASLIRTTEGAGESPVVQEAPFVAPQGVRPDGSIVHTVQEGDTLSSIVYAYRDYGVTVESIAELNESIKPNTRFLQIGQQITILPPGSVDPVTGRPVDAEQTASVETGGTAEPLDATPQAPQDASTPIPTPTPSGQQITPRPTVTPLVTPSGRPLPTLPPQRSMAIGAAEAETGDTAAESAPLPSGEAVAAVPSPTPEPAEPTAAEPQPDANAANAGAAPSPTAQIVAMAAPLSDTGSVCVTLFDDANQNLVRDADEVTLPGGEVAVTLPNGSAENHAYSQTADPLCIDLAAGRYSVSASVPEGYGLTTTGTVSVQVAAGRDLTVMFGGVADYQPPAAPEAAEDTALGESGESGAVAPIVDVNVGSDEDKTLFDQIYDHSGLILLGLAGVALVGGSTLILVLRRMG